MQLPVRIKPIFDHPLSPFARGRAIAIGEARMRAALRARRGTPAPEIDTMPRAALVHLAGEARADLTHIAAHVPTRIGPRAGLALGVTSAAIAGAAHGATGSAWIGVAMGIGASVASLYADHPDKRAAARSVAASMAAVGLYRVARCATTRARG